MSKRESLAGVALAVVIGVKWFANRYAKELLSIAIGIGLGWCMADWATQPW